MLANRVSPLSSSQSGADRRSFSSRLALLIGFGGLLLIIPRTRALGAIIIVPILTGIVLANINVAPSALPIAFALVAVVLWVIVENREKYLAMVKK